MRKANDDWWFWVEKEIWSPHHPTILNCGQILSVRRSFEVCVNSCPPFSLNSSLHECGFTPSWKFSYLFYLSYPWCKSKRVSYYFTLFHNVAVIQQPIGSWKGWKPMHLYRKLKTCFACKSCNTKNIHMINLYAWRISLSRYVFHTTIMHVN